MASFQHPDPFIQIPADAFLQIVHDLREALPDPLIDTPEARAIRDHAAIAKVAAFVPASPAEAEFAAQFVAAAARSMEALQELHNFPEDANRRRQLTAQAASMMREARGFAAALLRQQAVREKRESTNEGCERAANTEHYALGIMMRALANPPPLPGEDRPFADAVVEPSPPAEIPPELPEQPAQPAPAMAATADQEFALPALPPALWHPSPPHRGEQPPEDSGWPVFDPAVEAEHYARLHPRRAQLIRRLGGLPQNCTFGPPEPALVRAIVSGTSPALRALDTEAVL